MKKKEHIFTFKTDEHLADLLEKIPNKSQFIRKALQAALEQDCPLCQGSGILTGEQREHWQHFLTLHSLEKCEQCNATHLVCSHSQLPDVH